MGESGIVTVAIIGALQAVTIAILGLLSRRTGKAAKDTKETREQVVNHHDTNMRVENDSRHSETMEWFAALSGKMDRQGRRLDRVTFRLDTVEQQVEKVIDNVSR